MCRILCVAICLCFVFGCTGGGGAKIVTNGNIEVFENNKFVVVLKTRGFKEGSLRFSINGGADQSLFHIDQVTGELSFIDFPDFESPTDQGLNNDYEVSVLASDGISKDRVGIEINVKDLEKGLVWDISIGGSERDEPEGKAIAECSDGGFAICGISRSDNDGDKSQPSRGLSDFWVVKIGVDGQLAWDKRFGGSGSDYATGIIETNDRGLVLSGYTMSTASGDITDTFNGGMDFWVIKLDHLGNEVWNNRFGGFSSDSANSIILTDDGGMVVVGTSSSENDGDKSEISKGKKDYWIVKLSDAGVIEWDYSYGGADDDECTAVVQLQDGGFFLAGYSKSTNGADKSDSAFNASIDYWILRIDASGVKLWDRTFGGDEDDYCRDLILTSDGSAIMTGNSYSGISGNKTVTSHGGTDIWLVKIDSNGSKIWDKHVGTDGYDYCHAISACSNSDFILGCFSTYGVSGNKTSAGYGSNDYWIVRLDDDGNILWEQVVGGSQNDQCYDVIETRDGGYMAAGRSYSGISGLKSQSSRGDCDFWMIYYGEGTDSSIKTSLVYAPPAVNN